MGYATHGFSPFDQVEAEKKIDGATRPVELELSDEETSDLEAE